MTPHDNQQLNFASKLAIFFLQSWKSRKLSPAQMSNNKVVLTRRVIYLFIKRSNADSIRDSRDVDLPSRL